MTTNPEAGATPAEPCGLCENCRRDRELTWPVIDPDMLPKASDEAAKRLGIEPFELTERS